MHYDWRLTRGAVLGLALLVGTPLGAQEHEHGGTGMMDHCPMMMAMMGGDTGPGAALRHADELALSGEQVQRLEAARDRESEACERAMAVLHEAREETSRTLSAEQHQRLRRLRTQVDVREMMRQMRRMSEMMVDTVGGRPAVPVRAMLEMLESLMGTAEQDSAAVLATVEAYHAALARADTAAALRLLTPDVLVLESGGLETREEYRSHHLPADMAFAQAVPRQVGERHVSVQGDVAWVVSTSTTQGEFRSREIDSTGAELMVLTRSAGGWRIAAIHWSSRERRR